MDRPRPLQGRDATRERGTVRGEGGSEEGPRAIAIAIAWLEGEGGRRASVIGEGNVPGMQVVWVGAKVSMEARRIAAKGV